MLNGFTVTQLNTSNKAFDSLINKLKAIVTQLGGNKVSWTVDAVENVAAYDFFPYS